MILNSIFPLKISLEKSTSFHKRETEYSSQRFPAADQRFLINNLSSSLRKSLWSRNHFACIKLLAFERVHILREHTRAMKLSLGHSFMNFANPTILN